ncbi:MAG: diguanylate cyclase, partial [Cyanobacteria bacterium SZAS LIN-2]|nr:diguanylate cyclase [Cyanobacteria bacterium SZAS LIN-2]
RQALKDEGLTLAFCGGGFDALDELSVDGADVVVASTALGDLNGFQLAALIKSSESTQGLPVVLLEDKLVKVDDFWSKAAGCDLFVSTEDLKEPLKVAKSIKELAVGIKESGWKRQQATSVLVPTQGFSSTRLMESYRSLLDDLLLERIVNRMARTLTAMVEPRSQFLDAFFELVSKLFEPDLIGLVVADVNNPWAALRFREKVSQQAHDEVVSKITGSLKISANITVEVKGQSPDQAGNGIRSLSTFELLPVGAEKQGLGALVFGSRDKAGFSPSAKAFMTLLTQELKPVVQLLLAKQEIEVLHSRETYRAAIDSLTGLYNLEFLVGFLQQQLLFSFRQRLPVGMVIVDIDNFAAINQMYGYEFGDSVLTTMANRLLNVTRSSDLLARYGGDQFAVVLPNTDVAGAKVLAEKVRGEIEVLDFSHENDRRGPKITVSVGCACFNMEDLNPETILRDAKVALRSAKEAGRNRIATA